MFTESHSRHRVALIGVICAAAIVALYGFVPYTYSHLAHVTSVFGALWTMWNFAPDFKYGMIVPLLSAFIVYTRRKELAALPINGWEPGIVLVILTLALFWAGHRVDNQYIGFFSLQILIAVLIVWLLGWRWLVALAFPLAFLTFTWPLQFLDNYVTFPLRMFMANTSVTILNACGLPAIQNGSGILSAATINLAAGERFSVDVADPCSGIRSLFALMMVSAIYGNFTLNTSWKRIVLFLLSVPLAVLGNIFRILVLIFGVIALGPHVAIGTDQQSSWYHEGAGYVVFLVAMTGMLVFCKLLSTPRQTWDHRWRTFAEATKPTLSSHGRKFPDDIY